MMQQKQAIKTIIQGLDNLSGDSSLIIDFIRVLACEMVVFCHIFLIYNKYYNLDFDNANLFYEIDIFLGNTGVVLFFLVSGIVISNSLFKKLDNSTYGFKEYFIDRFSRIYMGLIPCLLFIFLCGVFLLWLNPAYFHTLEKNDTSLLIFLGNLLMLQNFNFIPITTPAYGGNLWTLNIEWWLYMLFGWIVINVVRRRKLGLRFLIPLAVFAYFPLWTLISPRYGNIIIVWFVGVAATLLYVYAKKIERKHLINIALCSLCIIAVAWIWVLYSTNAASYYDLTLEAILSLIIVLLIVKYKGHNKFEGTKIKSVIKFMGRYSYTLYLIHFVIEALVFGVYITMGWHYPLIAVFALAILLSNLAAIAIAIPTEMQYKRVSGFLKNTIKHVLN